ncbi:polysaccharide deacetylase family protein [Bradyrhizobium zhanjiangense]|uniref:Chitooligosaccharide deacetylase n=1 Tax=Bradyrhizobium zhanjiangense TaxID=1325107 RepID=A0ABY0DQ01_9BRAD|nr:polysaccharide deacetylase family protein [Bradyrhizobium zhanjiangense]
MSCFAGDRIGSTRAYSGHGNAPPILEPVRVVWRGNILRFARAHASIRQGAKRVARLTISLLYYIALAFWRFALQLTGRSPARRLVVIYYHGIPDAYRSKFVRQMESIRRGAKVFPAFHRGSLPAGKANVAITFDDAYVSVAENALPELASRGFHSTIFVPTATLGGPPSWTMEEGCPDSCEFVMPAEQIAKLASPLVTLGAHSCTHPRLSRLTLSDARAEIEGSRIELQNLTGQDIRLFSLPYGDHSPSTIELCREAGYEAVFSTIPTSVDTKGPGFVRGRVKVDPFDGRLEFFLKYNGAYAWAPYVSALKRTLRNHWQSPAAHLGLVASDRQGRRS